MVVLYTLVRYYATMLNYQQVRFFANSGWFAHDFALFRMHTHYFGGLVQGAGRPQGVPATPERPAGGGLPPAQAPVWGAACPLIRAQPAPAEPGRAAPVVFPLLRALPGRTKIPLHPPAKWFIIKPKNPHRK